MRLPILKLRENQVKSFGAILSILSFSILGFLHLTQNIIKIFQDDKSSKEVSSTFTFQTNFVERKSTIGPLLRPQNMITEKPEKTSLYCKNYCIASCA